MRNLKKFLALVLAMMMTLSLMVTANAKTTGTQYGDVSTVDKAFEEAVDVLTGMNIFRGDEKADLNAKSNVTRAEMAALIYRIATGDVDDTRSDLYKEYGNFKDVTADKWYAGYVGYCANAGYIKGTNPTTFNPSGNVTGYEALAMILRVIGYDKEGEFVGPTWQVNVSSLATRLGLLVDLKNANYDTNLQYASTREVIASLIFNGIKPVKWSGINNNVNIGGPVMVTWTPALHYQTWNYAGDMANAQGRGLSVGEYIFGLAVNDDGVVVGNEQTGEKAGKTIMGYGTTYTTVDDPANANIIRDTNGNPIKVDAAGNLVKFNPADGADNSAYNAATKYLTATGTTNTTTTTTVNVITPYNYGLINRTYGLKTGIDLLGHNLKLWYTTNGGLNTKFDAMDVFAYFDNADTAVVKADTTILGTDGDNTKTSLAEAIVAAGYKTTGTAVFNNSFGKFGSSDDFATSANVGNGEADAVAAAIASPVKLYKIIDNNGDKIVDAVISLNIETSRITEANVIRNVHTLGMPVGNDGTTKVDSAANWQLGDRFIEGANNANTKTVGTVATGVIAQDALVGNSAKTLGDYEMGIHITGTKMRQIGDNEAAAINGAAKADMETSYYLLNKVEATVTGKVVAYNANLGTVTLDNGTVLNRSKYYNTVVDTVEGKTRENAAIGGNEVYALPQSIDAAGNESYNFADYKFYTDYEGNYLGAERTYGNDFLYATYVDYDQAISSSAYIYKVTGVDLNGEVKTVDVSRFWADSTAVDADAGALGVYQWTNTAAGTNRTNYVMTGTNNLGVPFRDTQNSGGVMNYIGEGKYKGMTISSGVADPFTVNTTVNTNDYSMNMQRLGIARADESGDFENLIYIGDNQITLGVVETMNTAVDTAANNSKLFFNENTKFILVDGYGTANIVHEVYTGISALRDAVDGANYVTIDFNDTARTQNNNGSSQTVTRATAGLTGAGTVDVAGGKSPAATSAANRITASTPWNEMTYFMESPFTYDQSGDVAMKVDTIILPKDAVVWNTDAATTYYMGNPTATLVSSHEGTPIYQYTVYNKGVASKVWLTNAPFNAIDEGTAGAPAANGVVRNDSFLTLGNEVDKTDSGEPYYTATFLEKDAVTGTGSSLIAGFVGSVTDDNPMTPGAIKNVLNYTAMTRDAQAGTFTLTAAGGSTLLRVLDANVTNLNAADSPKIGSASGYIWPDITDVASLNAAASINPVTGAHVRVAIERDGLTVTQVYVCWDQNQTRP